MIVPAMPSSLCPGRGGMRAQPRRRVLAVAALAGALLAGCSGAEPGAEPGPTPPGTVQAEPTAAPESTPPGTVQAESAPPGTVQAEPAVPPLHPVVDGFPTTTVSIVSDRHGVEIPVRVAHTPGKRQQGLMHVEHLPEGTGMLFLFREPVISGFWMKNTLVPLDIAFVDSDGQIIDIVAMDPCEADPCPTYGPDGGAYHAALEVPQGWFATAGIRAGDRLTWADDFEVR